MELYKNKTIKLHQRFMKCYKKNTMAVFFNLVLTFLLITTMLILIHTNHQLDNIQAKTLYTPFDCYILDLSRQQLSQLKSDSDINHLAVSQEDTHSYTRNNQIFSMEKGDKALITMTAKIIKGRMPKKGNEVVAEKWVLLNLGIKPVLNQSFTIQDNESGKVITLKLVGILSDMYRNKKYGVTHLYMPIDPSLPNYTAYIQWKDSVNYDAKAKQLISELNIKKKQVKKNPVKEDKNKLLQTDIKIIGIIMILCIITFYGVFRITLITRENQYGILRAIGMKKRQLQEMILLELYQIYFAAVPLGLIIGLLLAYFITEISGDQDKIIYFFNERVRFTPVIPIWQITVCIFLMACFIGFTGWITVRKIASESIIDAINGSNTYYKNNKSCFIIKNSDNKIITLIRIGSKNILRDIKTSFFLILILCLEIILFTGLIYEAEILRTFRNDTKEMEYLNGQYVIDMRGFDQVNQGISRKNAEEIQKLKEVVSVKSVAGMPIRVVDEDKIKRNDIYYNDLNSSLKKYMGYTNAGYDGTNQVYKSILYGYNTTALRELKKYVIAGNFNPKEIKEDEIILFILHKGEQDEFPNSAKKGTPLMDYKVGDPIQIKYRKDLKTRVYDNFTDSEEVYLYKTYKISAIVSFEYMNDCNKTVYPLLITSDQQIQKLAPDSHIQCMYIDGKSNMSLKEQITLEEKLIQISSQNRNVSARSIIIEKEQNEMFYQKQMIYVYGIAIVTFVLVLINLVNNLRFRMQARTKEISMLRAIGMSVAMTQKIMLFENEIMGITAIVFAFILSHIPLRYLYQISDMERFDHTFQYNFFAFAAISVFALFLCAVISLWISKSWKTKHITDEMGNSK